MLYADFFSKYMTVPPLLIFFMRNEFFFVLCNDSVLLPAGTLNTSTTKKNITSHFKWGHQSQNMRIEGKK